MKRYAMRVNNKCFVALLIVGLVVAGQALAGSRNIKKEYIRVVRQRRDHFNKGNGISARYFSVGDPNLVVNYLNSWLNGVVGSSSRALARRSMV